MARSLNRVEKFYIDNHAGTMSDRDLARVLRVPVALVRAYLQQKPATPAPAPSASPAAPAPTNFAEYKGTVAMTASQSEADDRAAGTSPFQGEEQATRPRPENSKFLETLRNNIHVIDPGKPVQ